MLPIEAAIALRYFISSSTSGTVSFGKARGGRNFSKTSERNCSIRIGSILGFKGNMLLGYLGSCMLYKLEIKLNPSMKFTSLGMTGIESATSRVFDIAFHAAAVTAAHSSARPFLLLYLTSSNLCCCCSAAPILLFFFLVVAVIHARCCLLY